MPHPARNLVDDETPIADRVLAAAARRRLGDDARAPRLIFTVYVRGYAFAGDQR